MGSKLLNYVVNTIFMLIITMVLFDLTIVNKFSDLKAIALLFFMINVFYVLQACFLKTSLLEKIKLWFIKGMDKAFLSGTIEELNINYDLFNNSNYVPDYQYRERHNLFDSNTYLINPASGLPMIDNTLDSSGNMYGTNN